MNDNFIPTVTITLAVYQNMERRLAEADKELAKYSELIDQNTYLNDSVNALNHTIAEQAKRIEDLRQDNERLCRIVDGLQVQHRNDQGLD